ncbi:MAG: SBBP repeat-containing protein [Bryobacteraceae bacterium]
MRIHLICALVLFAPAPWGASGLWAASGLTYSTYLREGFTPAAIATDSAGNVYLAGSTPINTATSQTSATVVKLDPTGARYLYVRTFGGSASDSALGIAVDSAGNVFVTGTTSSPDFPITPGRQTGTLPTGIFQSGVPPNDTRAFLIEFDPHGEVLFSDVLGNVSTGGAAVALTPDGGILVSGASNKGLAASPGAYSVPDTSGRPFLMKLDATGSNVLFTATGIGGNALIVDAAGNIYMAGSTINTDYPTTPGAYQTILNPVGICFFPRQISFPGTNQYLTKVGPKASTLIYSTGVAGNSQTVNNGLAVDAAGNAYVTGVAYGIYSWTVGQSNTGFIEPFLTKIDAAGAHALYSIQIGGAGVTLGSQGDLYVGGAYNEVSLGFPPSPSTPPLPLGITNLPTQCQLHLNDIIDSEGYVSHVDAATGNVLSTVLVDGSNVIPAAVAYAGGASVWLAASTTQADTPITPGALTPPALLPGPLLGAYLGEASFSLSPTTAPQIACVLDGGNEARAGVVAPGQILSLFGTDLGPATGVAASDYSTTSLGGVTVTFGGRPATLLYVSSSQINLAVPLGVLGQVVPGPQNFATMQVSVNGVAAPPREVPLIASNPSLFANLTVGTVTCGNETYGGLFIVTAINADGTVNSCAHPAKTGTVVSFFIDGLGVDGITAPWQPGAIPVVVRMGDWSAEVANVSAPNPFVWQVDVVVPAAASEGESAVIVTMDMNFVNGVVPVGPFATAPLPSYTTEGTPLAIEVWVAP